MPHNRFHGPGDKKKDGDKKKNGSKTIKMVTIKKKKGSKGPGMGNLKSHYQAYEQGRDAGKQALRKGYSRKHAQQINDMVSQGMSPNIAERKVFNKFYKDKNKKTP